jgi:hypothetical protein
MANQVKFIMGGREMQGNKHEKTQKVELWVCYCYNSHEWKQRQQQWHMVNTK